MRNHDARVILAACLLSAAAAAQAPAIEDNRLREWDPSHRAGGPRVDAGLDDRFDRRPLLDTPEFQGGQDPQDYSLRGMFLDAHREFMNMRERYDPDLELGARFAPNQRINHEDGSFDWLGYDFDLEAPVVVAPDGYLMFGAYYNGRRYLFSDATTLSDENLTAAGLKIGFGVFLDENVFFEVQSNPGIWSDCDGGLHSEDYDFPSFALLTWRTMPNLFFKVGARYNQIYEDAPWLPYLGLGWEIVEGFRFDLLAPESLEFSFWPSSNTGFLFGCEVTGGEYHVRAPLAQREANPPGTDDLHVQEVIAYAGLMQRFNEHFSISVRGGIVLAGDYDLTTGATGFNHVEGALDQGFYGDIYFGIDF